MSARYSGLDDMGFSVIIATLNQNSFVMKTQRVIVIAFLLLGLITSVQDLKAQNTDVYSGVIFPKTDAVFIIDAGDRALEILPSKTLRYTNSMPPEMQSINTNLIESVSVIKGPDTVDSNGLHTTGNSIVMVMLKEGSFEKLPPDLAARFKVKQ